MGGLLGSAHCVGMCGGFALAIGATKPAFLPTLANQLVYSAGRVFTYAFLGALAGVVGTRVSQWSGLMVSMQQVLSVFAGVTMLVIGISVLFGLSMQSFGKRLAPLTDAFARMMTPIFKHFVNARGRWSFFLAGLFTGFLPCGLLYAFLAIAMAGENAGSGAMTMVAFGVGTIPAMVAIGCGGAVASRTVRVRVHRVAACFVVLLGVATVARGLPFVPCDWLAFGGHTTGQSCGCAH